MPKTMRDLRGWVNEKDEHGYLMPDEYVVVVASTAIYAHQKDCVFMGAAFETTTDDTADRSE